MSECCEDQRLHLHVTHSLSHQHDWGVIDDDADLPGDLLQVGHLVLLRVLADGTVETPLGTELTVHQGNNDRYLALVEIVSGDGLAEHGLVGVRLPAGRHLHAGEVVCTPERSSVLRRVRLCSGEVVCTQVCPPVVCITDRSFVHRTFFLYAS